MRYAAGSSLAHVFAFAYLQALFRKIAAALPGMESLSTQKQEDLVDVNLTSNAAQGKGAGQTGAATGCQC